MEIGVLVFLFFIIRAIFIMLEGRKENQEMFNAGNRGNISNQANENLQRDIQLPLGKRLKLRLDTLVSSRQLSWFESIANTTTSSELGITFFGHKKILSFKLRILNSLDLIIKDVHFYRDQEIISSTYGLKHSRKDGILTIHILPGENLLVDKIQVTYENSSQNFSWESTVLVEKTPSLDFNLFNDALNKNVENDFKSVVNKLLKYEIIIKNNPFAFHLLYGAYRKLNEFHLAEENIIKAMVYGLFEDVEYMYRELQDSALFLENKDVEELKRKYLSWNLDDHLGSIVLKKSEKYTLNLNGHYLQKSREILIIKRAAAGRMLTKREFDFSSFQKLLHTSLRVIASDGSETIVPLEQFTVGDSPTRNIHLTTIYENRGTWLLPKLSPGDIIEWRFDLLCKERYPGKSNKPHPFILSYPTHSSLPTLHAEVTFRYPESWDIGFKTLDDKVEFQIEQATEEGISEKTFFLDHYLTTPGNSNNEFKSPLVACALVDRKWNDIGKLVIEHNLGAEEIDDELPKQLLQILEDEKPILSALESSFYWIRDKLKYGAVESGLKLIGKPGRANQIIKTGIADCKDKSYLLYQICKKLKLKAEYISVNASEGIIIEELPADQFDHVFLRVQIDDEWIYLDASSNYFIFGFAPPHCQGRKALVLNDHGEIITIPEDSPYVNNLIIEESVETIGNNDLSGSFDVTLIGHLARIMDENWKRCQMEITGATDSAQLVLRSLMPELMLLEHDRSGLSSHSNVFQVRGTHRRGRVDKLGENLICSFDWSNPILPAWSNIGRNDSQFSFFVPESIDIRLILKGELYDKFDNAVESVPFENELCKIEGKIVDTGDSMILSRRITIKKKRTNSLSNDQLTEIVENIERAMRISFSLKTTDNKSFK